MEEPEVRIAEKEIAAKAGMAQRVYNDLSHHEVGVGAIAEMEELRGFALDLSIAVLNRVPPGREQASALTKVEEALFHANAGISRRYPLTKG